MNNSGKGWLLYVYSEVWKKGHSRTVGFIGLGMSFLLIWNLSDWIKNIQADCFWRSLACKRYQRYFVCMKVIVKNDTT